MGSKRRLRSKGTPCTARSPCCSCSASLLIGAGPGSPPRVESFSPEGLAKAVRQVAVRFSQPMVAFGDPRPRTELFQIDCPEPGVARWVDERSWVYDFARDLPAGVRCRFLLMPELRSLAGARLGGRREFSFDTGGPAIGTSMPWRGAHVAEDQRFVLRLDAAPDEASVAAHAFFRVDGVVDPIGVRVVTGAERDETLRRRLSEPGPNDLLIEARQRFPAGRQLELVWGPGIATTTGVATREAQRIAFRTRDALGLEISCPRENARADCLPLGEARAALLGADGCRRGVADPTGAARRAGRRAGALRRARL